MIEKSISDVLVNGDVGRFVDLLLPGCRMLEGELGKGWLVELRRHGDGVLFSVCRDETCKFIPEDKLFSEKTVREWSAQFKTWAHEWVARTAEPETPRQGLILETVLRQRNP